MGRQYKITYVSSSDYAKAQAVEVVFNRQPNAIKNYPFFFDESQNVNGEIIIELRSTGKKKKKGAALYSLVTEKGREMVGSAKTLKAPAVGESSKLLRLNEIPDSGIEFKLRLEASACTLRVAPVNPASPRLVRHQGSQQMHTSIIPGTGKPLPTPPPSNPGLSGSGIYSPSPSDTPPQQRISQVQSQQSPLSNSGSNINPGMPSKTPPPSYQASENQPGRYQGYQVQYQVPVAGQAGAQPSLYPQTGQPVNYSQIPQYTQGQTFVNVHQTNPGVAQLYSQQGSSTNTQMGGLNFPQTPQQNHQARVPSQLSPSSSPGPTKLYSASASPYGQTSGTPVTETMLLNAPGRSGSPSVVPQNQQQQPQIIYQPPQVNAQQQTNLPSAPQSQQPQPQQQKPQLQKPPSPPQQQQVQEHSGSSRNAVEESADREGYMIHHDEIRFIKKIGVGGCGEVWQGEWTGTPVAVKKILSPDISEADLKEFSTEILLMSKLRHPNIVPFLGACVQPEFCLITEFMQRGSLFDVLASNPNLSLARKISFCWDIAKGILYLHTRKPTIIHRDIKSLNILVTKEWKCTIADFGFTKIKDKAMLATRCGSPAWSAPEVCRGEPYNEACDIYSYGIVMWEILAGEPPYRGMNPMQLIGLVAYKNFRPECKNFSKDNDTQELVSLMKHCWSEEPSHRPNFFAILERLRPLYEKYDN